MPSAAPRAAVRLGALSLAVLAFAALAARAGGSTSARPEPVPGSFAFVAAGSGHSCGIAPDGALFCWGENSNGELGVGGVEYAHAPVRVAPGRRFKHVSVTFTRTCAVDAEGRGYCWGSNPTGARTTSLKALEESSRAAPVPVAPALRFEQVGAGTFHTCGLTTSREIWCWGQGQGGVLGDGRGEHSDEPVRVAGGPWISLAVGEDYNCAVDGAGGAYCWGDGARGRLGDGRSASSPTPVRVRSAAAFQSVSAGEWSACAVARDGSVWCWGSNENTQLGARTTATCERWPFCSPTPVRVQAAGRFRQVSAGDWRTCAVAGDGRPWCWGRRTIGGQGRDTTAAALPQPVPLEGEFRQVSVASSRVCGVAAEAVLSCWTASLGLPPERLRRGPTRVPRFVVYTLLGALIGGTLGHLLGRNRSLAAHRIAAVLQGLLLGGGLAFGFGIMKGISDFLNGR